MYFEQTENCFRLNDRVDSDLADHITLGRSVFMGVYNTVDTMM